MNDQPEDLRSIPSDQRNSGPNETMMISSDQLESSVSAAAGEKVVITGTPRLIGKSDVVAGVTVDLVKEKTTIGRQEDMDIVIQDGTVSARHAQIVQADGVWRVINLISTNGTSVNGATSIVSYLAPGDVISFGRVEMNFEVPGMAPRNSAPSSSGSTGAGGGSANPLLWAGLGAGIVVILGMLALVFMR